MEIDVTIGVITYNSAKFIQETLDSCIEQIDENIKIEIFISDDASTDNTQSIITNWLKKHSSKFESTTFIKQEHNLGGRKNSDFVLRNSHGQFLRTLEGDDILVPNAIKKLFEHILNNPKINFLFSNRYIFKDSIKNAQLGRLTSQKFINASAKKQYEMLLTGMQANGPTTFFNRALLIELGGRIGTDNIGDLPTMLNITGKGHKIYCLEEPLLYYRKHDSNMSSSESNPKKWQLLKYEMKKFRNENLIFDKVPWHLKLFCCYDLLKAKKNFKRLNIIESLKYYLLLPYAKVYKNLVKHEL